MTKKMKIAFALGLQLAIIASIGDFVGWPFMKYVLISAVISFALGIIFLIAHYSKD